MKKIIGVAIFISIFFTLVSFTLSKNRGQLILKSGLYIISSDRESKLELNQTGKFYGIQQDPLINIKHIISERVGVTPMINGIRYPTLTMTLDSIGINAINNIKDGQQIGLILNNKLRIIGDCRMLGDFKGPDIKLQGDLNNSYEDFGNLKKDMDALH